MTHSTRIALAQSDFLVGDVDGNARKVVQIASRARDELGVDAVIFPELTLIGYPPEDLLLRRALYPRIDDALQMIAKETRGIDVIVGYPVLKEGDRFNAAGLIRDGAVAAVYYKHALPNYAVFDEKRYFTSGTDACVIDIAGTRFGLTICEDVWEPEPVQKSVAAGAQVIINMNASPYHMNKWRLRQQQVIKQAQKHSVPVVYINLVGGQDELVFDGHSFVVSKQGEIVQSLPAYVEELAVCVIENTDEVVTAGIEPDLGEEQSVYQALVLGVRDYVNKNGFDGVVIGLSGGIDSALTLTLAVDALGADRVEAVMMPSAFTSEMSIEDARAQAGTLGVAHTVINIGSLVSAYSQALQQRFSGLAQDVTEENIQARIRGNLLMAISNKTHRIVLATGNKSEMAVGYATLYGDMAGGFAAIKDVPKTMVYRLARYRNGIDPVIPERVLTRAPTAELAPGQKDTDSLPEYDVLDSILERYVEKDESAEQIIAAGFAEDVVFRVLSMVDRNEYKRRQAAPGVRITPRAFGRDRRYPITSGYRNCRD